MTQGLVGVHGRPYTGLHMLETMIGITSPTAEDLRGGVKSYGDGWYCWHRNWGKRIQYTRMPDELETICKNDDGYEAIKVAMSNDGYEVRDDER